MISPGKPDNLISGHFHTRANEERKCGGVLVPLFERDAPTSTTFMVP